MAKEKRYKCIACKRPVEVNTKMGAVASGPACIPCFFAAKLKFENGITDMKTLNEKLPAEFVWQLQEFFRKVNCTWPDELMNAWEIDFEKVVPKFQEWWFGRSGQDAVPND